MMDRVIAGLLLALLISGCASTGTNRSRKSTPPYYDLERNSLHPLCDVFHFSEDSSRFILTFPTRDLLFTRNEGSSVFSGQVRVDWSTAGGDTITWERTIQVSNPPPLRSQLVLPFAQASGTAVTGRLVMTDTQRSERYGQLVLSDKRSALHAQNFAITDSAGWYFSGTHITDGADIRVSCPRCPGQDLQVYRVKGGERLPPPPYESASFQGFLFPDTTIYLRLFFPEDERALGLQLQGGKFLFTQREDRNAGRTVQTAPRLFPEVTTSFEMAECLRYITPRSEYRKLMKPTGQRSSVEAFWLKCSDGRQDKARDLIRIYYTRILESNLWFSEMVSGWKTDRGMVHVIMGQPNRIERTPEKEVWVYGEDDQVNSMVLVFNRAPSLHTTNRYVLERSERFRDRWNRDVTNWRNGRIYAD